MRLYNQNLSMKTIYHLYIDIIFIHNIFKPVIFFLVFLCLSLWGEHFRLGMTIKSSEHKGLELLLCL